MILLDACLVISFMLFLANLWTIACQAPLSMGFSRQEYWSGLPFPSLGDLPNPGIEPMSLMSTRIGRQVLSHFLIGLFAFLGLSSMHCFYILEINPLSVVSFATIFFHSEGCLFTLLIVSFAMQKLLSLIRSD